MSQQNKARAMVTIYQKTQLPLFLQFMIHFLSSPQALSLMPFLLALSY